MTSFWRNATTEQKLAQIDAGIELGMTIRQIAMNVGGTRSSVAEYGRRHGRKFNPFAFSQAASIASLAGAKRGGSIARIVKARAHGAANTLMKDAFDIFGTRCAGIIEAELLEPIE